MPVEKKKIMLVAPSLKGGGAEKVAATLIEAFATAGDMRVLLVLLRRETVQVQRPNIGVTYLDLQEGGNAVRSLFKLIRLVFLLARIIRQERPGTIVSFMDYLNVACIMGRRFSGVHTRVVLTVHTLLVSHMERYAESYREKVLKRLALLTYGGADAIIAVSKGVRDDLASLFRIDASLVHVVPNPVDVQKIQALSGEAVPGALFAGDVPVILSAGRLSKEKGFDCLMRSFAGLKAKHDARLVILGEGKEEDALRILAGELGISDDVFFAGYVENPWKYMRHATMVVVPSLYEGFGMVIVEAMACGVPVIATRAYDGIEDIVEHGASGLLVLPGDESALTEAMYRLLTHPEEGRLFAAHASAKLNDLSAGTIAQKYRDVMHV
ncbi:MAG: glycosyltransferase [Nitrospirae bacterium]|nr:glycosyltransferase [Nitrospirota bacterium]